MARVITGNNTASITLSSGDSPVTVTGTIDVAGAGALYGPTTGAPWTITNASTGLITTGEVNANGVSLVSGTVINEAGGTISSSNTGSGGTELGDSVIIGSGTGGGAGTIENYGLLTNSASAGSFVAELDSSGSIINEKSGTIAGVSRGVGIRNDASTSAVGSVTNLGTIIGSNLGGGAFGVAMIGGDVVNNGSGGVITGFGVGAVFFAYQNTSAGTLINAGSITDANGVNLETGGIVTNEASGVINASAGYGVMGANTLLNYGAITASGSAVYLANFGLLVAEPSSTLSGVVDGSAGTLALASGNETVTNITNFNTVAFDTGATAEVAGSAQAWLSVSVTGFVTTDTLEITGATDTIESFSGGVLVLGGTAPTTIDIGVVPGEPTATATAGNTDLTVVPCFRAGTRILTDAGELTVEELKAGMRVVSYRDGCAVPVTWIGHRRIDCARHPRPQDVWPVRVAEGAFGEATPHRTLYLSPDHAVFVNNELVPVRYLVNGMSIAQIECSEVTYFHVEIADHGVLLANGLPAESYLDTGNRALFGGEVPAADVEKAVSRSA